MSTVGQNYVYGLGYTGLCGTTEAHLHQSADIGSTTDYYRTTHTTESCWSDITDSTQCPSIYNEDYAPFGEFRQAIRKHYQV